MKSSFENIFLPKFSLGFIEDNLQNRVVWATLAFQAGWVNVGGFLACHRFVTHVTGFASQFGFDLASFKFKDAVGMITVPLFFLIGSMISAFYVDRPKTIKKNSQIPTLYFLMGFFFLLVAILGSLGAFGIFGQELDIVSSYVLIALLCLASGIQNAATSSTSNNFVRTTHLTGITTDLGIGLVRSINRDQPHLALKEKKQNAVRIILILSFVFGSAWSSFVFIRFNYFGFLVPSLISFCIYFLAKRSFATHD